MNCDQLLKQSKLLYNAYIEDGDLNPSFFDYGLFPSSPEFLNLKDFNIRELLKYLLPIKLNKISFNDDDMLSSMLFGTPSNTNSITLFSYLVKFYGLKKYKYIDFSNSDLQDGQIEFFLECLLEGGWEYNVGLDFSNLEFSKKSIELLKKIIDKYGIKESSEIDISNTNLTEDDVVYIFGSFFDKPIKSGIKLYLTDLGLSSKFMTILSECINKYGLEENIRFGLEENNIGDEEFIKFVDVLNEVGLKEGNEFNFDKNHLTDISLLKLSEFIEKKGLTAYIKLYLISRSVTPIKNKDENIKSRVYDKFESYSEVGVLKVLDSFKKVGIQENTTIHIGSNDVSNKSLIALADILKDYGFPNWLDFRLSGKKITISGIKYLLDTIENIILNGGYNQTASITLIIDDNYLKEYRTDIRDYIDTKEKNIEKKLSYELRSNILSIRCTDESSVLAYL